MVYDVTKITTFGQSILPTPLLISSISKAKTTTTAPVVVSTEIVLTKEDISDILEIHKIVLNGEIILNLSIAASDNDNDNDNDNEIENSKFQSSKEVVPTATATTTPVFTDIELNEKIVSNSSVAASDNDNDDEINNMKFQSTTVPVHVPITTPSTTTTVICTEMVLNVAAADDDGIWDEFYQLKQNYDSNIQGIHSIMSHDGEILLLPIFNPLY